MTLLFQSRYKRQTYAVLLTLAAILMVPTVANAHVKWFSEFSFADRPLPLPEVATSLFWGMMLLSFVAIAVAVVIDRSLEGATWYQRVNQWLDERKDNAFVVMRVAAGATLLMSWQADALLVPELDIVGAWVGWLQFAIALLLLLRETTPIAGVGLVILYAIGVTQYGIFYMLDYVLFLGVAWFLIVNNLSNDMVRGTGIPALYITIGFSLIWVGLEKLIYPQWSFYILEQNPQLTLGFPVEFFLVAAAFIELALGYLLVIGLLGRPLSLVITLVFFLTSTVFGKVEVIGHTIIHGALIAFLLQGPGEVYKTPVALHEKMVLRTAFASVTFVLVIGLTILPYSAMAQQVWRNSTDDVALVLDGSMCGGNHIDIAGYETLPGVAMNLTQDANGNYVVEIDTKNFTWAEESDEPNFVIGEGHAHIYLDGEKVAASYSSSYVLPEMNSGLYEVRVSLVSADHQEYLINNLPIEDSQYLRVQ